MSENKPSVGRREKSFEDLIRLIQPRQIVEFGSWEGRSCIAFLDIAYEFGLTTKILCVDTWLGSSEHWGNKLPNTEWSIEHLRIEDGEPQVIKTFKENIHGAGYSQHVSILRCPTEYSSKYLMKHYYSADLIYIDASHEFRAVLCDLEIAKKSFMSIYISGDDFLWPGVRKAVARFALKERSWVLIGPNGSSWLVLSKSKKYLADEFSNTGWIQRGPFLIYVKEVIANFLNRTKHLIKLAILKK